MPGNVMTQWPLKDQIPRILHPFQSTIAPNHGQRCEKLTLAKRIFLRQWLFESRKHVRSVHASGTAAQLFHRSAGKQRLRDIGRQTSLSISKSSSTTFCSLTVRSEQGRSRNTRRVVLPSRTRTRPDRPVAPITIRSAASLLAAAMIFS